MTDEPQIDARSTSSAPPPVPAPAAVTGSTDGFAIASLVLGILGVSLLGLIFGIVGMRRTKDGRAGGRGMAVAGVVLSITWMLVTLGLAAFFFIAAKQAATETDNAVKSAGLTVGDCISSPYGMSSTVTAASVVSCYEPHRAQVLAEASGPTEDCVAAIGQLTNATAGVNYYATTFYDSYNAVYWCGVQADSFGQGTWTGSWLSQDVTLTG